MCGIAGLLGDSDAEHLVSRLDRMAHMLVHRGPDSGGVWVDATSEIGLAQRRLSIIDLSPAGHQPMHSPCGRYVLVYNGEIYNHSDLRVDLEAEFGGFNWRGHSDTETLLAALCHWGIQGALTRLNGMFAFALWDTLDRRLFLARDRMGEKPLYYGRIDKAFIFGSELKALTVHPAWNGKVDRNALALFMRYSYVPAPFSIYESIFKLPPAHFIVIGEAGHSVGEPVCYWKLSEIAANRTNLAGGKPNALADELDTLLRDSVRLRMEADVPLGAFLSGGYDSSTVVSLMQAQSMQSVKTFSIGFLEESYNEARDAKAVAKRLGTDHTELYLTPMEAMAVIPKLPSIYDEPFSDSSQIPTVLVSQLARQHVTVSLSGDGGDELFCGYNRYALGYQAWQRLNHLSPAIRRAISWALSRVSGSYLDKLQGRLPRRLQISSLADRLPKFADALIHQNGFEFYKSLVSHWKNPNDIVLNSVEPETLLNQTDKLPSLSDMRESMMYLDAMTYLPDDILTKVDRASMAVSLEARVPLLDHRLVEFAWRVPIQYKYRDGKGKWLLQRVLYRYVPQELMDRPKMGFSVPIENWLRGPLREWAESLLSEQRLREDGFFNPTPIRKMWQEHITAKQRWHYYLWDVLMFQSWLHEQRG